MSDENSVDFPKPQIEREDDAAADATILILAEVLCVFAARGRALREERAKHDLAQPETVAGKAEHDQNPQ